MHITIEVVVGVVGLGGVLLFLEGGARLHLLFDAPIATVATIDIMATPLPQTTLRLVKEKAESSYKLKEVALPALQGDELLVKVGKVALCGTDISLYQWNAGEIQASPHRIL